MVYTSGVSVSVSMTKDYSLLCQSQLLTWCVHHRFDEEVQEDTHGSFTPEMMKFPQATRIETFLEGVTDKKHWTSHLQGACLVFPYEVSGFISVISVYLSHTNLVLRESLDTDLHHLLPWNIDVVMDESSQD